MSMSVNSSALVRSRIMRRRPGVWLVADDCPGCGHMPPYTVYSVRIYRPYDRRWYRNYHTNFFRVALDGWKRECARKWPNTDSTATAHLAR